MEEYLYRYVSFETFVGMLQSKALTFVLPELWDDPQEYTIFDNYISTLVDNPYYGLAILSLKRKAFCQCWTLLSESDAMWRIYCHGNHAIRIKIKQNNVKLLDDVSAVRVQYSDELTFDLDKHNDIFLECLSKKRTAFNHEQEIRLIKHYKFSDKEDCIHHIHALLAVMNHPKMLEFLEKDYPGKSIEEKAEATTKLLNCGNAGKEYINISYSHIPGFIEGALVHPLAPEWYVDIVQELCARNEIPFEGKSTLYSK